MSPNAASASDSMTICIPRYAMSQRGSSSSDQICSLRNGLIGYASPSFVRRYLANTSVCRASSMVWVEA